jgi:uncharacterized protein YbjT (DUF2867 family)
MAIVVVLGSSGTIGSAVIHECEKLSLLVYAGVRDPHCEEAKKLFGSNVCLFQFDMGKPETFDLIPKGAHAVFVNVPNDEQRTQLAFNGIDAAKQSSAKHIVVLSVCTADNQETVFGKQFQPIESHVAAAGLPFTILRLPLFTENFGYPPTIKEKGVIYGPVRPDASGSSIAVRDVGSAFAHVMANPSLHSGQIYNIACKPYTRTEAAKAFSAAIGKNVRYEQVSYEAAKKTYLDMGMEEWQVNGILELFHAIDDGKYDYYKGHDFATVCGKEPLTIGEWTTLVEADYK